MTLEIDSHEDAASASDAERARISRRRVLQAGLATGVAAAAWSAPRIVSAQQTPGFADVCTVKTSEFLETKKKNMTCETGCEDALGNEYLTYQTPYNGDLVDITFSDNGSGEACSADTTATVTPIPGTKQKPSPIPAGSVCVIGEVVVFNQSDGSIVGTFSGDGTTKAPQILKQVNDSGNCAFFYGDITIECCPANSYNP